MLSDDSAKKTKPRILVKMAIDNYNFIRNNSP